MYREGHGLELVTAFAGDKLQNWLNHSLQGRGCTLQVLQELLLWGFVSWAVTHRVSYIAKQSSSKSRPRQQLGVHSSWMAR